MPLFTIICRISDKLLLVESMDTDDSNSDYNEFRKKGKKLFYSMSGADSSSIINAGPFYYLYILENDVCFMTFCDKMYPKKLAYKFLEELKIEFTNQYGNEVKQKRLRPFHFERFDNVIQKVKKLYKDTNSTRNLNKVASDLKDINKLLQQNIDDILERGRKIDGVAIMSEDLVTYTRRFELQAKELVWQQLMRKWSFIGLLLGFVLFVAIFFCTGIEATYFLF